MLQHQASVPTTDNAALRGCIERETCHHGGQDTRPQRLQNTNECVCVGGGGGAEQKGASMAPIICEHNPNTDEQLQPRA